jgi:hypothetical protein
MMSWIRGLKKVRRRGHRRACSRDASSSPLTTHRRRRECTAGLREQADGEEIREGYPQKKNMMCSAVISHRESPLRIKSLYLN